MFRLIISGLFMTCVLASSLVRAATPAEIDEAIKKAKAYLYNSQKDGNWENIPAATQVLDGTDGMQWGGLTSLVTYALLADHEDVHDPRLVASIEFLKKTNMKGIYSTGMRCQVWSMLPPSGEVKNLFKRDLDTILGAMKTKGDARGMFSYVADNRDPRYDHSVSQYAVLGAWACAEADLEVPTAFWEESDRAWRKHQNGDGGWGYIYKAEGNFGKSVPALTTAGIASMFITQEYLGRGLGINCSASPSDENIARGTEWIAKNWGTILQPNYTGDNVQCYVLYGVERVGVASGHKYFGDIDWYKAGADFLVKAQRKDGSTQMGFPVVADTAFSLLFLVRGRAPVAINKLEYDIVKGKDRKPSNWNQRPRDAANLSRWTGRQTETFLNWQIVNLKAPLEDLLEAPILYVSGDQPLSFSPEEEAKLKQYIEMGGLMVCNANCGNKAFAASVRNLGSKLFPKYEFRELNAQHPIFNSLYSASKWKNKPSVMGLSNGARELIVLIPAGDAGRAWQMYDNKKEVSQLGINLVLYSADRAQLQKKGSGWLVHSDPQIKTDREIKLARIDYPGNWDPEPGGWRQIAAVMRNDHHIDLKLETVKLGDGKLDGFKIAHLTGTVKPDFNDGMRDELKKFVASGGTLLIDSAGGSSEFSEAIEKELGKIFPDDFKQLDTPLSQGDTFFRVTGSKGDEVTYRSFARKQVGQLKGPRLRAIKFGDRFGVIFSREDLSVGLVGHTVDGINGYEPKTASALVADAILSLPQ